MTEIIVYRSPFEAAMWHSMSDGNFFPIIVGVIVFFAVFLGLNAMMERIQRGRLRYNSSFGAYYCLFFAALIAFAVMYRMYSIL
jgi:hypothetical protein